MKKNILFDFAETIAELKPTKEEVLRDFLVNKDVFFSEKSLYKTYKHLDMALPYSSVTINNSEDKKKFYLKYNNLLFKTLGLTHLCENLNKEFFEFFLRTEKHWALKQGIEMMLGQLKHEGYSLSIISNFDVILREILQKLKLSAIFDYVYISQEVGLEKPDCSFYKSFFECSNYNKNETLYVGDSYLLDYLPAKRVGLDVYLLDENDLYRHIPERIESILDIKECLLDRGR